MCCHSGAWLGVAFPNRRCMGWRIMAAQREVVEQLFEAALALKPAEREAFFNRVCSGDPGLRRMVEDLLADDARAGSFLRHPPLAFLDNANGSLRPIAEGVRPIDRNTLSSGTPP